MLSLEKIAEEWLLCSGTWSEIEFLHDNNGIGAHRRGLVTFWWWRNAIELDSHLQDNVL